MTLKEARKLQVGAWVLWRDLTRGEILCEITENPKKNLLKQDIVWVRVVISKTGVYNPGAILLLPLECLVDED